MEIKTRKSRMRENRRNNNIGIILFADGSMDSEISVAYRQ
jgi:hypothetical protein